MRQEVATFDEGLSLYQRREFARALAVFTDLAAGAPCPLYTLYCERVREFRRVPPPADWDGVYVATAK